MSGLKYIQEQCVYMSQTPVSSMERNQTQKSSANREIQFNTDCFMRHYEKIL